MVAVLVVVVVVVVAALAKESIRDQARKHQHNPKPLCWVQVVPKQHHRRQNREELARGCHGRRGLQHTLAPNSVTRNTMKFCPSAPHSANAAMSLRALGCAMLKSSAGCRSPVATSPAPPALFCPPQH
eukprot:TRINITY_DN1391_c0_g1_i2.p1 TRINITY_DN1391_c0_g1~~TRINITY_DN1391_c0_g1_i2.p1  ORF type:complete len:128 (+),score=18.15 TRINITY_DN1391_c0_g1_i2:375-758(+)